ncbi:zinc-binding dehydrogenase [Afifella sp. IM 167]|uniref:zinc-binding dehydrogenase n=1 Tax=Afifella sp. IM 167 TaxID=2033586 RepID=UPI001CCF078E|nr:zinc-binding dehydrogenase [Afifella sp. IM 167]
MPSISPRSQACCATCSSAASRAIALARPSVMAYVADPRLYRAGAQALFAALQDGLVNPVGAEYPLAEAATAHAELEAGRTTGSVILTS